MARRSGDSATGYVIAADRVFDGMQVLEGHAVAREAVGRLAGSGSGRRVVKVANMLSGVTFDCLDPQRVARFWSALLGREPGPSEPGWVYLGQRGDPEPRLVFQPVPEPKVGKVRIHLDVTVGDVNEAIGLVTALGGRSTGERHDYEEGVVVVMADPEGHEFCLVQYY